MKRRRKKKKGEVLSMNKYPLKFARNTNIPNVRPVVGAAAPIIE